MKWQTVVLGATLILTGGGSSGAQEAQPVGKVADGQAVKKQTLCPVMGGQVKTSLFVDYGGKRVYFCCNGCPTAFKKAPAKYIAKLEKDGVTLDKALAAEATGKQVTNAPDTSAPAAGQDAAAAKGSGGHCN